MNEILEWDGRVAFLKHPNLENDGDDFENEGDVFENEGVMKVWVIENAELAEGGAKTYTLFDSGLHEHLGLEYKDQELYDAKRGELTKLVDTNGDGKADVYETVYAWPLSGHYHEYSFGPKIAPDGSFFVTGNVAFGDEEWWRGESRRPWRGWTMNIHPDGTLEP